MAKRNAKTDAPFEIEVQKELVLQFNNELAIAEQNHDKTVERFMEYYDMIHCKHTKQYEREWESDIYMPEFVSRILMQIGNFVSQYFSSEDFVTTKESSEDPQNIAEAKAARNLLNKLLNKPENHYYHKIVRLLMFVFPGGYGIIKGGYQQETREVVSHYKTKSELKADEFGQYLADDGLPYEDPFRQKPAYETIEEPVFDTQVLYDGPTFDVYPIQNVLMSPEYTYSIQDKEFVIFYTETDLYSVQKDKPRMGYFNLGLLEEELRGTESQETGKTTWNRDGETEPNTSRYNPKVFLWEVWEKYPVKDGKPGIDRNGDMLDGAELKECILTYAAKDGIQTASKTLIRFQESPHSKRPMCRFSCYIDAHEDNGFGDGELIRELQIAANDSYNLMNHRTKMAISPAFKARRFAGIDKHIRLSSEEAVLVENMDDLQEIKIEDNINGGIILNQMLSMRMDGAMASSPIVMGQSPDRRETATTATIQDQRASIRIGMKSMNLEFIGFTEFYGMLLSLCNDFMLPQTLEELLGEEAVYYNPKRKVKFRPVSQALESDEMKQFKVKMWSQILQIVGQLQNPKTPMVVNYIIGQILELWGGDFKQFKKFMFEEDPQVMLLYQLATGSKGGPPTQMPGPAGPGGGPQNQHGMPQRGPEQMQRGVMQRQKMMQ